MKKAGKFFTFKRLSILFYSTVALAMSGCIDDFDDVGQGPNVSPVTYVSFYHAAAEAQNLDVYMGDYKLTNQPFKYSDYSDYLTLTATQPTRRFKFTPYNASNALIDSTITLRENKAYSLFATGRQQNLKLLVVEDSLKVPSTGKANIRIIHLSPDAPSVDIATTGTNGSTLFTGVDYKENSLFKEVTAGSLTFQVKQAGGTTVLLSVPDVSLQAGRIYTLVLRGLQTPPSGNTNSLSVQVIRNH